MVQMIQNPLRKRNKSEADKRLERVKGNKVSPISSVPGGNSQGFTKVGWEDCSRGKRAEEVTGAPRQGVSLARTEGREWPAGVNSGHHGLFLGLTLSDLFP